MTSTAPQTTAPAAAVRNVPARVAAWSAGMGVSVIISIFTTPMLWLMHGGIYTFFLFVFGLVAIPAGHLGRFRGKRLGGHDRGLALAAIVTGWLLLLCTLLIVLAYAGLMIGLTALFTSAS
ncbi:hypothetical protein ACGFW5_22125 [Streptomyces sp. NPDC048416]|uniref:hypothetical protein n=1 Tax=Streptomyces sp. NPDC048416 TaxID=3365546 RepID=UPI00371A8494